MPRQLIFALEYDKEKKKWILIDPPPSEEKAWEADMVQELFLPQWGSGEMPKTISFIILISD